MYTPKHLTMCDHNMCAKRNTVQCTLSLQSSFLFGNPFSLITDLEVLVVARHFIHCTIKKISLLFIKIFNSRNNHHEKGKTNFNTNAATYFLSFFSSSFGQHWTPCWAYPKSQAPKFYGT